MKTLPAKTAFLHKNFREMGFELKVIFMSHILTAVCCFMPWISYVPLYGDAYFDNGFGGPTKVMGMMIFLIALIISFLFLSKLFKSKSVRLPVEEEIVFIFGGVLQIILIICAWSVLLFMGSGYDVSEIRFGLFFCLLLQIFGLVAAFLLQRGNKKEEVVNFFHQAEEKVEAKVKDLFSHREISGKK